MYLKSAETPIASFNNEKSDGITGVPLMINIRRLTNPKIEKIPKMTQEQIKYALWGRK